MTITPDQIKAARALAGISQTELADSAGLSQTAIAQIENRKVQPVRRNIEAIRLVLEKAGVEFIEGGVRMRPDGLDILRGADFGPQMMDYMFAALKRTGGKIIMINALDIGLFDDQHNAQVAAHVRRLIENGIEEKILVPEGTKRADIARSGWGRPEWYRTMPSDAFSAYAPSFIFADCYGIMLWEQQEIFIIRNRRLADDQVKKFMYLWKNATPVT